MVQSGKLVRGADILKWEGFEYIILKQTASTHASHIPPQACASLVCIVEYTDEPVQQRKKKNRITHIMGTRGSISARCCMLKNRSLNRLPSGYPSQGQLSYEERREGCKYCSTYLESPQTLAELLAELHVHLLLAHDVLTKSLPHQPTLRETRLLPGASLRRGLGTCC